MPIPAENVKKLADLYYTDIYKFACAKTRNKDIALEITQQTFLTFIEKAPALNDDKILPWLICVCANKVKESIRKESAEKMFVSLDEIGEIAAPDIFDAITEDVNMFNEVQQKILAILTPEEQKAFIALFIKKKDIRIFAEENGISENVASTRKSRLKKKALALYKNTYFMLLVICFKLFSSVS